MNIDNWQNQINDIENYKTQGTIIRSKKNDHNKCDK